MGFRFDVTRRDAEAIDSYTEMSIFQIGLVALPPVPDNSCLWPETVHARCPHHAPV